MKAPGRQSPRTAAELIGEIDRGEWRDKVSAIDPAAAPLGTDEEAGGAAFDDQTVVAHPPAPPQPRPPPALDPAPATPPESESAPLPEMNWHTVALLTLAAVILATAIAAALLG